MTRRQNFFWFGKRKELASRQDGLLAQSPNFPSKKWPYMHCMRMSFVHLFQSMSFTKLT